MVPRYYTCVQFVQTLRIRWTVPSQRALYFLSKSGKILLTGGTTIGELYDREKDDDGYLYIVYAIEDAFGLW